jgi:glycerol-3-phosphate dehydrogenase
MKPLNQNTRNINSFYSTIIIGGGINGAGLIRDLSLHNISSLMIDSNDFCSQTSQSSSKMLHGGIRYLEKLDFNLVKEALEEKNLWLKLAPHLVKEKRFYMPVYKESKYPLFMLAIGIKFYDLLSRFQNSPSRVLRKKKLLEVIPELKQKGLKGAGVYYDALVDDSKLGLECIWDALISPKVHAQNYMHLDSVTKTDGIFHLEITDKIQNIKIKTTCKHLVFATGPFTDKLFKDLKIEHWEDKIIPNKGIHLWLDKDCIKLADPMVLQTKDNRIIFVIPQRDAILVGTTETLLTKTPFNITANDDEISYLIDTLKNYFPENNISKVNILSTFAGIRPLVRQGSNTDINEVSRHHKVFKPYENSYVLLGGKLTTFRKMVQEIVKPIVENEGGSYNSSLTMRLLRHSPLTNAYRRRNFAQSTVEKILRNEKVESFEDLYKRRLSLFKPSDIEKLKALYDKLKD